MEDINHDLTETIKVWPVVSNILSTIHTEQQYKKAVNLLDKLIDQVSEQDDSTIESLIDTLGKLIKD